MTCALLLFVLAMQGDGLSYYSAVLPKIHDLDASACEKRGDRVRAALGDYQSVARAMVPDGHWIAWDASWTREAGVRAAMRRVFFTDEQVASWKVPTGTLGQACLGAREWFRRSVVKRAPAGHGRAATICWHPVHGAAVAFDPYMSPAEHAEKVEEAGRLPPVETPS